MRPLTLFSVFGLVALSGIVVNDSIVLIDFIRRLLRDGSSLETALLDAGCQRFRPVLLTSVTTIACMLPLLTETSVQARQLIPMAVGLCFGLVTSTTLVLVLVRHSYWSAAGWKPSLRAFRVFRQLRQLRPYGIIRLSQHRR